MSRFHDRLSYFPAVGRYGDQVDFLSISSDLQTEEIATIVGALRIAPGTELFIACGSPGETENFPELGYHYNVWNFNSSTNAGTSNDALEWPMPSNYDQVPLIENLAMKSQDQLRQRVAWSLANMIVIASQDTLQAQYIDAWAIFYDIFTRNAFGSYLDILREVSHHPLMGIYLTYLQNQAYAVYSTYPDENYAREVMQLFSIGLWQLNDDYTQKLDSTGNPIATYTNDDIVDFARVWTGFDRQAIRSNLASIFQFGATPNLVDPMQMKSSWHDRFPKAKLDSGYLGDTYPLCDDMPAQAFLRQGARYEYTGTYSVEGDIIDQEVNTTSGLRGRFTPPTASALYQALCAPSTTGGACTFPLVVTLSSNLACTGTQECNAQRVISVKIIDPVANLTRYYSYIAPPCVRLTLFSNGQTTVRASNRAQCANPATRVGYPMCCNTTTGLVVAKAQSECLFANEVTDYATNQQRCANLGLGMCTAPLKVGTATNWLNTCAADVYAWTNTSCSVQIQVYQTGQIGIIDPSTSVYNILNPSSNNIFRVRWDNGAFPTVAGTSSCPQGCTFQATPDGAGSCTCNITVTTSTIFGQLSDLNSIDANDAVNAIAQKAFIGSVQPSVYDDGAYTTCSSSECTRLNNVVVWLHKDDNGGLGERTIFQLPAFRLGGRVRYLMNKVSTVSVSNSFSFRNPPNFSPLIGELSDAGQPWNSDNLWIRRAENEVDALLEHLFEHDNTAVFVTYRLIQQMVTSNPSPRYMKSVVNAFRTGTYNDINFSGKYGDLGAAVYAILVDQEARSPIVEVDRTYGMLKDPLVKLYQFMRSLEYTSAKGREVAFWNTDQVFGVQPFTAPTVFGFYLPEYRPDGIIGDAGIVSPQTQLATTPNLVGFLNGVTSLVDNGLTSCDGGLGLPQNWGSRTCVASGPHPTADGILAYAPPDSGVTEDIIDELNMLLLGGRLNSQTRDLFVSEYNNMLTNSSMAPQALRHLLKLFAISAEYQATNFNNVTTDLRTSSKIVPSQGRRFRAIIVVNEMGGCDSFSVLVPHSNCPNKDMYAEYVNVRTDAALNKTNLLPINVPAGTQPCNTFGVHYAMPMLQQLYNDGDALFAANVGALVEPLANKSQMNSARLPPSLFAHNIMQRNVQNVYAQLSSANGVLGRMTAALLQNNPPYASGMFSLGGLVKMVQGPIAADYVSPTAGFIRVRGLNQIGHALQEITQYTTESVFSDTYADGMHYALNKTEALGALLSNTTLQTTFGTSFMDLQMQQVAKLIKLLPDNGVERAMFYTWTSGFDTHATFDLKPLLSPIDTALGTLATELKAQGKWDDVVVISVSDFARTLTSNGRGTDHAWGGNYWVAGGSVKGGQILGKYPDVLSDDGEFILSRGRVVPTTPFEGLWQGISEWFGVPEDQMQSVLPNLNNFGDNARYTKEAMFKKF